MDHLLTKAVVGSQGALKSGEIHGELALCGESREESAGALPHEPVSLCQLPSRSIGHSLRAEPGAVCLPGRLRDAEHLAPTGGGEVVSLAPPDRVETALALLLEAAKGRLEGAASAGVLRERIWTPPSLVRRLAS